MRHHGVPALVVWLVALGGCSGGDGQRGDRCDRHGDCDPALQCAQSTCVPRCQRAPDCGDGYSCDQDGVCQLSAGGIGHPCQSEVQCGPGLTCAIDNNKAVDSRGRLLASCRPHGAGRPAGETCTDDDDCRNGGCELGHCTDLCRQQRDCALGTSCVAVPRVAADGAMLDGCVASTGTITWKIPIQSPSEDILLPVPDNAVHVSLVMTVDDHQAHKVGVLSAFAPSGARLYRPCPPLDMTVCSPEDALEQYYDNKVRHVPGFGMSVFGMPSNPDIELEAGAHRLHVSSLRPTGSPGSAIPSAQAVVRVAPGSVLDLHFYFHDLSGHPCSEAYGTLDKTTAPDATFFKTDYIGRLREIFRVIDIHIGEITYEDIDQHHELGVLEVANAGALLQLGAHDKGINVFFVRSLSPAGVQAFGPNPGPARLATTRQSGVIIGVDSLCYRSWEKLARLTAHELARYMGLYHNVESGFDVNPAWRDPIADSTDSIDNLMFYSERSEGIQLSPGQANILRWSPVLR